MTVRLFFTLTAFMLVVCGQKLYSSIEPDYPSNSSKIPPHPRHNTSAPSQYGTTPKFYGSDEHPKVESDFHHHPPKDCNGTHPDFSTSPLPESTQSARGKREIGHRGKRCGGCRRHHHQTGSTQLREKLSTVPSITKLTTQVATQ